MGHMGCGHPVAGHLTTTFASIFNAANIVDGWFGADTIVASTAKDVFLFQTGIAANKGLGISGKTIQKFQIGTDAIAVTNYQGSGDNVFVGSTAAETTFDAVGAGNALLASANGWTWALDSGKTDAGTLTYVGAINESGNATATNANFNIHLVGVQGTIVGVDSFFPVA